MKKLYLFSLALVLTAFCGYSQNLQNANWYFGNHAAMTFLPNPATPTGLTGSAMFAYETCASVSDQSGQLLFYSEGMTIWNRMHQPMTNGTGLQGSLSDTQMAIVPRPGFPNRYYVIVIDGASGNHNGLTYTEVDMSLGAYGEVIPQNKNINFKDHNGININLQYSIQADSGSEKVTTAPHCNGVDYWVVTQIKTNIYSYLVTAAGINTTPAAVSPAYVDTPMYDTESLGPIKISPDSKHIAIDYSGPNGSVMQGSFDNATGLAVIDSTPILPPASGGYFGLEFSPSSEYLYFVISGVLYVTESYPGNGIVTAISTSTFNGSLQLAINGKIYMTEGWNHTTLAVLNTPDTPTTPGFQAIGVNFGPAVGNSHLPQWVHWQKPCIDYLVLNTPDANTTPHTYQVSDYILTHGQYLVNSSQDITMKAGNLIVLQNETHITGGAYWGVIEDCNGGSICEGPPKGDDPKGKETIEEGLQMYPNPANEYVNFTVPGETINQVMITELSGLTLINEVPKENKINVARLNRGIYMVVVTTQSGKIYRQNLAID